MSEQTGISLIAKERERQVTEVGWDSGHDDEHDRGQMADAASCYAANPRNRVMMWDGYPAAWPWADEWWRPEPENRLRELVKAGALIAAEIDRLLRPREAAEAGEER